MEGAEGRGGGCCGRAGLRTAHFLFFFFFGGRIEMGFWGGDLVF